MDSSITKDRKIYIELNNKNYAVIFIDLIDPHQVSVRILEHIPEYNLKPSQTYITAVTKCSMTTTNIGKYPWEMTLFSCLINLKVFDDNTKDHFIMHSWWYRENLRLLSNNILNDLKDRISASPDLYTKYSTSWISEAVLRGSKIRDKKKIGERKTKPKKPERESHEDKWKRWKD